MPSRPVVALLTDFGTRDHYVGTMKGVVLGICPEATLVDISHELAPQDIVGGALELAAAYQYFPAGTIFLVVIDPGVGSSRRGIAAEIGRYTFVAPDNGVLTAVCPDEQPKRIVELTEPKYARSTVSRTFEGRDRFAPAAAWLASGVELGLLGTPADAIARIIIPRAVFDETRIAGEVLRVDRFGNLITNIDRPLLDTFMGAPLEIRVGPHYVSRLVSTYAEAAPGELCAVVGSTEQLEIAVNGASAALALDVGRGAAVHVARRA